TRRITERVARSTIFLVEEIADVLRVVPRNPQFFAHFLVEILCQRFGSLNTQPVQVEILGILTGLKQTLRFHAGLGADRNQRQADDILLVRTLRCEEVGNRQLATLPLARESEAEKFFRSARVAGGSARATRAGIVHDHVVALALGWKISVNDFGFE